MVIVDHAGLPLHGGFTGVDVFFVISGFVITLSVLREVSRTGRFNIVGFYLRRARRLLPALSVAVSVTLLLSIFLLSPFGTQRVAAITGLGAATLSSNLVMPIVSRGYFTVGAQHNPLLHMWSLSFEEQFYLFFPFLVALTLAVVATQSGRRRLLAAALVVVGVASFAVACLNISGVPFMVGRFDFGGYYGPLGRVWEFALGCLVGVWAASRPKEKATPRRNLAIALAVAGAAGLTWSGVFANGHMGFPGPATLAPTLATVAIIVAGELSTTSVKPLTWGPLTRVGDWSYSLYLWHWPFVVFANVLVPFWWSGVVGALFSVIPAVAAYYLVEQRFLTTSPPTIRSTAPLAMVACGAMVVSAGGLGLGAKMGWRDAEITSSKRAIVSNHLIAKQGCEQLPSLADLESGKCVVRTGDGTPVYLIGDSHADHVSEAVAEASPNSPLTVAAGLACPIHHPDDFHDPGMPEKYNADCARFAREVKEWLTTQPAGIVVVSSADMYWSLGERRMVAREPFEGDVEAGAERFRKALNSTLDVLEATDHKVVLVQTVPTYWYLPAYFDPQACSEVAAANNLCRTTATIDDINVTQGPAHAVLKDVAAQRGVAVVDPRDVLCPDGVCHTDVNGKVGYRDTNHLTTEAALTLTPLFREAFNQ